MTFVERLRAAMKAAGKDSDRDLSLEAGLSHGSVNFMFRTNVTEPKAKSVRALARVLKVNPEWLLTGKGEPGIAQIELHVERTERYAGRAEAERLMRGVLPDPAVDSVLPWDLNATQDPGVAWWIERMKEAARTLKHWDKNPSAERAELEKRRADGDVLEAVLDGMQANAAAEQAKLRAAETANDAPPAANDPAPVAPKPARKPTRATGAKGKTGK